MRGSQTGVRKITSRGTWMIEEKSFYTCREGVSVFDGKLHHFCRRAFFKHESDGAADSC